MRMALRHWAGTWATLCLPAMLVLLVGLVFAWQTGQLDPRLWSMPATLVLGFVGFRRGIRHASWVAGGGTLMILLFCWIAAARAPGPVAATILWGVSAMAILAGSWLRRGDRRVAGSVALLLAAAFVWRGGPALLETARARPELAVITALPLFWDGGLKQDAPIVRLLQTRFMVRAVDDPAKLAESGVRHLLLAQPRALSPDRLVAIDAWVRSGGRALVLADPLLRWETKLPMGDRRAPPAVSLLDPLLDHWGVRIGPVREGEERRFSQDGELLTLSGFGESALSCGGGTAIVSECRIGKGRVVVVADADLIDDRLWLSDPARPLDPRVWTADTPALVTQWLGASMPGGRRWMRDTHSVALGVRWALLAGTIWAMTGMALLHRLQARRGNAEQEKQTRIK